MITITESGSYIVTQDFPAVNSSAITINANHVTIDLDGHTITGGGVTPGDIITNGTTNSTDIHIKNGNLVGGYYAVHLQVSSGAGEFSVESMTISQPPGLPPTGRGIRIASSASTYPVRAVIYKNTVQSSTSNGIQLGFVDNGRVEENVVRGAASYALLLSSSDNNIIRGNTLTSNSSGIAVTGYSNNNLIVENNLSDNSSYGLDLFGTSYTVVSNNTISRNTTGGVYLSGARYNTITGNNVSGSLAGSGIYLVTSSYNDIKHNTLQYNRSNGLYLNSASLFNVADSNTAALNGVLGTDCGIKFSGASLNNLYANNKTLDNGAAGCFACGICGTAGNINGGGNIDVP